MRAECFQRLMSAPAAVLDEHPETTEMLGNIGGDASGRGARPRGLHRARGGGQPRLGRAFQTPPGADEARAAAAARRPGRSASSSSDECLPRALEIAAALHVGAHLAPAPFARTRNRAYW
jgi:hypothetical protein